jgi:hypothetical protein
MPLKEQSLTRALKKARLQTTQALKKPSKVSYCSNSKAKCPPASLYALSTEVGVLSPVLKRAMELTILQIDVNKRIPSAGPQTCQRSNRAPLVVIMSDSDDASSSCRPTKRNQEPVTGGDFRPAGTLHNPVNCDPLAGSSTQNRIDLTLDDEAEPRNANRPKDFKALENTNSYKPGSIGPEARPTPERHFRVVDSNPTPTASTSATREQPYEIVSNPSSHASAPSRLPVLQRVTLYPSENAALAMDKPNEGARSQSHNELFQSAKNDQSTRFSEKLTKAYQTRDEAEILISNLERHLLKLENWQGRLLERRNRLKSKYPGMASKRKDYQDVCKMLEGKKASIRDVAKRLASHKEKRQAIQNRIDLLEAPADLGGRGENSFEES